MMKIVVAFTLCFLGVAVGDTGCPPENAQFYLMMDRTRQAITGRDSLLLRIEGIVDGLKKWVPGAEFAVGSYSDRNQPTSIFGTSSDYCYRLDQTMTSNTDTIVDTLKSLTPLDGGDIRNSQLTAMYFAIKAKALGWESPGWNRSDGALRVLILTTASDYHVDGDAEAVRSAMGFATRMFFFHKMIPISKMTRYKKRCMYEDYAAVHDVRKMLIDYSIFPVFVASKNVMQNYRNLLEGLGVPGLVVPFNNEGLDNLPSSIQQAMCPTAPPPTTPTTTTTAAPTTTTTSTTYAPCVFSPPKKTTSDGVDISVAVAMTDGSSACAQAVSG